MKKILLVFALLLLTVSAFADWPNWISGSWEVENGQTWTFQLEGEGWGIVLVYDADGEQVDWWGWEFSGYNAGFYINRFGRFELFRASIVNDNKFRFVSLEDASENYYLYRISK